MSGRMARSPVVLPQPLEAAQRHFQHKQYDMCLLTLHAIAAHGSSGTDQEAHALAAMCMIYKHTAVQEWHKVSLLETMYHASPCKLHQQA